MSLCVHIMSEDTTRLQRRAGPDEHAGEAALLDVRQVREQDLVVH